MPTNDETRLWRGFRTGFGFGLGFGIAMARVFKDVFTEQFNMCLATTVWFEGRYVLWLGIVGGGLAAFLWFRYNIGRLLSLRIRLAMLALGTTGTVIAAYYVYLQCA
jgi:hypothetical protein